MRTVATVSTLALIAASLQAGETMSQDSLYSFKTTTLQGKYAGLEKLHQEYSGRGFSVLGFPSNDFGGQEPGSAEEIAAFCQKNYGVTFPMFSKLVTKTGADQSPIYTYLGQAGELPRWNFAKYLVGKDGKVIRFFDSKVTPESPDLRQAIDAALAR